VTFFEVKYQHIDLDRLHERVNLLQTQLLLADRERLHTKQVLSELILQVNVATKMYLKVRKAKELEHELPGDDAYSVDNRSWRRLLEMERKAHSIIERVARANIVA
jgi:hypothetical protein